ncbi:MAG: helix-turn-helix transcriptional regulator [Bacteroidota bacterium]
MKIGKKLKSLRNSNGFTSEQVAQLSGLSQGYISKIENDKTNLSLDVLQKYADAIRVTILDIFTPTDILPTKPANPKSISSLQNVCTYELLFHKWATFFTENVDPPHNVVFLHPPKRRELLEDMRRCERMFAQKKVNEGLLVKILNAAIDQSVITTSKAAHLAGMFLGEFRRATNQQLK